MDKPIYNFKKSDVDYEEKKKQYLINLTKYKYYNDEIFRNNMKTNSQNRYNKLKKAFLKNEEIFNEIVNIKYDI